MRNTLNVLQHKLLYLKILKVFRKFLCEIRHWLNYPLRYLNLFTARIEIRTQERNSDLQYLATDITAQVWGGG